MVMERDNMLSEWQTAIRNPLWSFAIDDDFRIPKHKAWLV